MCLARQAVGRVLELAVPLHEDPAFIGLVQGVECNLLSDRVDPLIARRLAGTLVGLVEDGQGGTVRIEWGPDGVSLSVPDTAFGARLKANGDVDEIRVNGDRTTALIVGAGKDGESRMMDRIPNAALLSSAGASRFRIVPLPEVVTGADAVAIRRESGAESWLALDAGRVWWMTPRALDVWRSLAEERRRLAASGGRLCLMGLSSLLERILRRRGLHHEVDVVADPSALESLGRRLTSLSERASILDSVVERT